MSGTGRSGALIAACAIVFAFLALLEFAFRPTFLNSGDATNVGFANIVRTVRPPPPPLNKPARRINGTAPATSAPSPAPALNPNLLSALACLDLSAEERRKRNCPAAEPIKKLAPWERSPGGPQRVWTREEIYTRAELMTTHKRLSPCDPPPTQTCIPMGRKPPPPSKTPAEYCRAANMGGPCEPPPQDRVVPE